MPRSPRTIREGCAIAPPTQLALPFLTRDDAATVDAAREAIDRALAAAVAARRSADAAELARIGAELVDMLERNATAHRARQ